MADITWKTPSPRQRAGAASQIADLLRSNPGEWAIIDEYPAPTISENPSEEEKAQVKEQLKKVRAKASSRASQIKQGRVPAYRHNDPNTPGAFQALARTETDPDGTRMIRVFAVYLTGQDATDYLAEVEVEKAAKEAKKSKVVGDGSGAEEPVSASA